MSRTYIDVECPTRHLMIASFISFITFRSAVAIQHFFAQLLMATGWHEDSCITSNSRTYTQSSKYKYNQERRRSSRYRVSKSDYHARSLTPPTPLSWPVVQPYSVSISQSHSTIESTSISTLNIPNVGGSRMERTPSGNTIILDDEDDATIAAHYQEHTFSSQADHDAAAKVSMHVQFTDTLYARELRELISTCRSLDAHTLSRLFTTADAVFFNGALSGRVCWEWSSAPRYISELVGTTALRRRRAGGGFECLIVLSEPLLTGTNFERRLAVGVFLHELVHCYLFVTCGFEAKLQGGHTDGFHRIVDVIDRWVGRDQLRLCSMRSGTHEHVRFVGEDDGRWEMGRAKHDLHLDSAFPVFKDDKAKGECETRYDCEGQKHDHDGCDVRLRCRKPDVNDPGTRSFGHEHVSEYYFRRDAIVWTD